MAGDSSTKAPTGVTTAVIRANGAAHTSSGQRPGYAFPHQALKGRHNRMPPGSLWPGCSRESSRRENGSGQTYMVTRGTFPADNPTIFPSLSFTFSYTVKTEEWSGRPDSN